eukprot:CAMPEP_0181171164 /NCGR_PEP_ID=MMETSP1096-20121128/1756_1 /TAXON_ID=156174 ORGANISM="Chrysochromulina ericina, Strain CCMP281" /NCGR_SAMPLE_ID=MMETSP1096 /ASSEMBLY_ACC=CAM_ASM_000453 /LENGTH=69 /DNA_ID=CAMNT_0023258779 /DNA_START=76 /DNA_END=285 /DNA_ORIENTATION=-
MSVCSIFVRKYTLSLAAERDVCHVSLRCHESEDWLLGDAKCRSRRKIHSRRTKCAARSSGAPQGSVVNV